MSAERVTAEELRAIRESAYGSLHVGYREALERAAATIEAMTKDLADAYLRNEALEREVAALKTAQPKVTLFPTAPTTTCAVAGCPCRTHG